MTATELASLIGQTGTLTTTEGFKVQVIILDARDMFGRTDVLVSPPDATEENQYRWVNLDRIQREA